MNRHRRPYFTAAIAVCAWFGLVAGAVSAPKFKTLRFDQLLGWEEENHAEALKVFTSSCMDISAVEWGPICQFAGTQTDAKTFFELFFTPVIVNAHSTARFTGYFEPELNGSRKQTTTYRYPIYKKPKGLIAGEPGNTRAEIDAGALAGKNLAIAYVDDPVEAYYLHIQGSGRIKLRDGSSIRVGYAGENGHVYRSAPGELVRQGEVPFSQASINGIKAWAKKNPLKSKEALQFNASYVFFHEVKELAETDGPFGALARPITALRSIAVDPKYTQMGAPVWVEKGGADAMRRLMIAQDVGSAIKGAQRADIFYGTGDAAGERAGKTNNRGRMVVLLPIEIANRLAPEG